ncbi:MAG: hypothetical protein ABFC63_07370 [Thermoguttaceae bacterium]
MRHRWLWAAIVILLLAGCSSPKQPGAPATDAGCAVAKPEATDKRKQESRAKLPTGGADEAASRVTDDFGFPLVIHLDAPEVPKEIQGPSPPITEPAKPK